MAEPRDNVRSSSVVQWRRTVLAMGLLFGSLPVAARLILGDWEFQEATGLAILCLMLAAYLHVRARRGYGALPDDALVLERALDLAAAGRADEGIALLTRILQSSPRLWQALQYRGQLHLARSEPVAAIKDFADAIRLAPGEAHLYVLRGHAFRLLGDEAAALVDNEAAASLGGTRPERL